MKYGLQLYTLRELTAEDMGDVLSKVSQMGYKGVEIAGFGNLVVDEFVEKANENNLEVISAHVSLEEFQKDLATWVSNARKLETTRLTLPYLSPESLDEPMIEDTALIVNDIIEDLKTAGITLSYHNHDFEFQNGRFDRLMSKCPLLQVELDTYWVKFAGIDPIKIMKKYTRRISLIHLKDMLNKDKLERKDPNPVLMTGKMDVRAIVRKANQMNIPWGIIEMDETVGDSLEDVKQSLINVKEL